MIKKDDEGSRGISNEKELLYPELTYKLRGIFFEVYNELGPGFKESVYVEAIKKCLKEHRIRFREEVHVPVHFKGGKVGDHRIDLVVDGKIVVEVKAVETSHSQFRSQTVSYLRASGLSIGFLVNFGSRPLQVFTFRNRIKRDTKRI